MFCQKYVCFVVCFVADKSQAIKLLYYVKCIFHFGENEIVTIVPVRMPMKTTLCDATLLSFQEFARIKLRVAPAVRKNCTSFFFAD